MALSEVVKRAALKWVQATADEDATEVTGFSESSYDAGGCDTCGHDLVITIDISFETPNRKWGNSARYEGSFVEFINTLDQYDI